MRDIPALQVNVRHHLMVITQMDQPLQVWIPGIRMIQDTLIGHLPLSQVLHRPHSIHNNHPIIIRNTHSKSLTSNRKTLDRRIGPLPKTPTHIVDPLQVKLLQGIKLPLKTQSGDLHHPHHEEHLVQ